MSSLATIPEDRASVYTSESQSENFSVSQSKILILNEAKEAANLVRDLYLELEKAIKDLPQNIRQDNDKIFKKWRILLASVASYAKWGEHFKGFLNLRLQNAPGDDGM